MRQAAYLGTLNRLHVAIGNQMLIAHVPIAAAVTVGDTVGLAWNESETLVFSAAAATETTAE